MRSGHHTQVDKTTSMRLLLLLLVCTAPFVRRASGATVSASGGVGVGLALRIASTPSHLTFLTRISQQYNIMRPEIEIEFVSTTTSAKAFDQIARGAVDLAISSLIPTPADMARAPDLLHLPLWAYAYAPVTNVPALGGMPLLLSVPLLCSIFSGQITFWNDSSLVALNPLLITATTPIEIVLSAEAMASMSDFTGLCAFLDPSFGTLIPSATLPKWPRQRYQRSTIVPGMTGPTSYVIATPNTISLVVSSYARKLGANLASMLSRDGSTVLPNYETVDTAATTQALLGTRDNHGQMTYMFSNTLSFAAGNSWPLVGAAMMAFPRTFTRTTCRAQAELVKFLRWIFDDESVRYSIGMSEDSVLMPESIGVLLGLRAAIDSLRCGPNPVNIGSTGTITAGSELMPTSHTVPRLVLASQYSEVDESGAAVTNVVSDPSIALDAIRDPQQPMDVAIFFPQTYRHIYKNSLEQHVARGEIRFMPFAAYGVIPSYSFGVDTLAALSAADAFPLKVDMETLGGIFTGAIRSWTDPALVGFNPALGSVFSGAATPESTITLVLCGDGDRAKVAHSTLSSALVLSLSKTLAVADSGLPWSLPADWRPVTARLDSLGVRYVMVHSEVELDAAVTRIPGAVGYKLSYNNASNPESDFAIIRTVQPALEAAPGATAAKLHPYDVTVFGEPAAFRACAEAAERTNGGDLDLQAVGWSAAPSAAHCWPLSALQTIALPADIGVVAGSLDSASVHAESLDRLCETQKRVARYAEFLLFTKNDAVAHMTGFASMGSVPWVRELARRELNGVFCGGKPLLYELPVVWAVPAGLRVFAQATSGVVVACAVVAAVLVLKFRARSIIRTADLPLQLAMLTGLIMLLVCPILFVVAPAATVCHTLSWLVCIGFTLTYAPIAIKIWRVRSAYRQRRKLKIRQLGRREMYAFVLALLVVDALLLAAQSSQGSIMRVGMISRLENNLVHQYEQCTISTDAIPIFATLVGIKGALLVATCMWAFGIRHVSSAFGDSANLSWAVWNSTFSAAILAAILALVGGDAGDVHTFLLVFLVLWVSASTLFLAFGHKLLTLLIHEWRSAAEASRMSRTSRTSNRQTGSNISGTGTGTGSGSANSAIQLPSLDAVPLAVLERYMTALETQLRMAKDRRQAEYGAPGKSSGMGSVPVSQADTNTKGWRDGAADQLAPILDDPLPLQARSQPQPQRMTISSSPDSSPSASYRRLLSNQVGAAAATADMPQLISASASSYPSPVHGAMQRPAYSRAPSMSPPASPHSAAVGVRAGGLHGQHGANGVGPTRRPQLRISRDPSSTPPQPSMQTRTAARSQPPQMTGHPRTMLVNPNHSGSARTPIATITLP